MADQAITELKDIPELVSFGLQIATEPEVAKGLWKGIKGMTPAKVKKMLLGAASDKLAKYSAGGNTMKHEVGKDVVSAGIFIFGAVKKLGSQIDDIAQTSLKAADLDDAVVKKLDDVADESLEQVSSSVDEITGKSINKSLSDLEFDNFTVESNAATLADAASKAPNKKLTWEQVKALFKRGNDFNKKGVSTYGGNFSEIHLGNKKRLDTYIPGQKIISRKATDIDNISELTWRNYCSELVTKYKVGTPVNSSKLLNEPPLTGKYYLEIPASNQSASKLQQFRDIAKQYGTDNGGGIEVIFLNE